MVQQTITYNSPNQYFAGFIQNLINISEANASVSFNNNTISLFINDNNKNLGLLDSNISKYLPHSIFIGEIQTAQSENTITPSNFTSKQYNIAPCNKCLEMLNDPSSPHYLDESLKCDHYSNSVDETYEDYTIFSPHYSEGSAVLIADAHKINDLFIVTEDEIKALFSIEKPTIKVTIKDETLKELTKKNYIYLKAPYNNRSALAAINAKESGVEYLFFEDTNDLKIVIVQKNTTIIKASRVATTLKHFDTDPVVNRFLNIKEEAGFAKGALAANLSTKGINFLVSNEFGNKKVITFQEFSLIKLLENFQNDEKRSKLYTNFNTKYPDIVKKLENNQRLGLFETVSVILELQQNGFETLSDKGYEFRGNGGLKVDMNYINEGFQENEVFDYYSFIGSIISFKLAGVDTHYLAYSIFEAIADMAINTLNQLKEKFKLNSIIMMGDMFSNSVLYSRILSKYQLSNPYFSKAIALDN